MPRVKRLHLTANDWREKLLEQGVKNLKQFGYPHCTVQNITTDMIYRKFFLSMLEDRENVGQVHEYEQARRKLIEEIKAREKGPVPK